MFATRSLRAGGPLGFWRRSLEELKRQATIAIKMEGLHVPKKPFPLIKFDHEDKPGRCKLICDSAMGGFSKADLTFVPGDGTEQQINGESEPAHAVFKGSISTELPPNRLNIQRSGYAAWRTHDRGASLFGKLLWDIDPYAYLALRVKSDGRKYFVNIQTESIVPTDLHQHLLPCYTPGEWETITIPFAAFVRTNYGLVVEPQREMLRQKVRSVGIGLIDRLPGAFELRIAEVYATNQPPARQPGKDETGFDLEDDSEDAGILSDLEPRRKKGEPERILI